MRNRYQKTKIACYIGYVVQAVINNFLPILFVSLQNNYQLSYEKLGRIVLVNFCTQLLADFSTTRIVARLGYHGSAVLSQALAGGGLCLLALLPAVMTPYIGILISVVIYAFGSGLTEVIVSPIVDLLPSDNKGASMAFLHSFYCWGQAFTVLGTTALGLIFGGENWRFIPLIWAVIPIFNAFFFLRVPVIEPGSEKDSGGIRQYFFTRQFFCFVIFMFCAGASEIVMAEWASMFAQKALHVSAFVGDLTGPCLFAICMGIGRIIFGIFSGRFSYRRALILNNILCCACYIVAALAKQPVFALAACGLCGFSVSLSWPGTYSLAAARFPNGGTLMFSIFAICGDIGCAFAPWLVGMIADHSDLKTGFFVSTVFPLIMVLTALSLMKEKDCKLSTDTIK